MTEDQLAKLREAIRYEEGHIPTTTIETPPNGSVVQPSQFTPSDTNGNGIPDYIDDIKQKFQTAKTIVSPIVLDLNGDGITTTAVTDGAYFDHDGNGFAEATGWVNPDDGILVLDRNGNGTIDTGRELFGSETLLADGSKAANGYQALAELDTNQDGQINNQDAAYATLQIWKDTNGDGYSSADELYTLADAGVQSIATGYVEVPHIVRQSGTYTRTDGSTGDVADLLIRPGVINPDGTLMINTYGGYGTVFVGPYARLADGQLADNAYQLLADLDSNHDGLIDQQDAAYTSLIVWKDTDGDHVLDADERLTLADAGIQSITTSILTDPNGNSVNQTGTFTRTDGSTGNSADIWFDVDKTNTIATEWLPETAAIAALPDLQGYGNVRDLHQAMLRDTTGHLQDLMQQFVNETDYAARRAITTQLIYAWAGVENIDPASRGWIPDARQLYVIEAFLGEGYIQGYGENEGTPNTGWNAAAYLMAVYNQLSNSLYNQLMAQTHLKPLLDTIAVTWNTATSQFDFDISNTVAALQNLYDTDRNNIVNTMLEVGNTLNLSDSGKQVLEALRAQGDSAGSGFTGLLGRMGIDNLIGDAGNNTLTGTDKDEGLYGYGGNDTLDGGAGNDYLQGSTGNDVYLFNLGSGRDGICDMDSTPGNLDTVRFGAGIAPGDITFARHGYDLVLSINGTDQLTLQNWGGGDTYRIERFEFADTAGTVWDAANDAKGRMAA